MRGRAGLSVSGVLLVFGLSACPVTDDYFIETAGVSPSAGDGSGSGDTSMTSGASGQAGSGGMSGGSMPLPPGGRGGMLGEATAGSAPCMGATERCNGHDDDCNGLVDEDACNGGDTGTTGCAGFVVGDRLNHGYMLCRGEPKDYAEAKLACQQQSMRLAWLETEVENEQVTAKVKALASEAWIGASDSAMEGEWRWDGARGERFWSGDESGMTVNGSYAAWMDGAPNDDNGGEDCAVLQAMTGEWGDRACCTRYAYLCEEP
jgi:hypothetical protein